MEDVNMDEKKNMDLKGFKTQAVDLNSKDSLQKVVELIGKLTDADEVKNLKLLINLKLLRKFLKNLII